MPDYTRYALYYSPPAALPITLACNALIGRDPVSGKALAQPDLPGLSRPIAELTEAPRKYGLHGTLKAPFRLREGREAGDLLAAARALCATIPAFDLPSLDLTKDWPFLALVPTTPSLALNGLAEALVTGLDDFRAPLTEAERVRRRADELPPHKRELLERWGYPHVLDEFRFHLTLTGRLEPEETAPVRAAYAAHLAPLLPAALPVSDVCLFGEEAGGGFRLVTRIPLGG